MPEEQMRNVIRAVGTAFVQKDVEKLLSFFAEDATLVAPQGTFRGKEEIKRYKAWLNQQFMEMTLMETNLLVQGNKAAHEYVLETTTREGWKLHMSVVSIYEFTNDKVQEVRDYCDRLSAAKRGAKGWFAKWMVNSMVKRMDKGL